MPDSQAKASPPLAEAVARQAFRRALLRWFAVAGRDLPWRRTRDPYAILVSELMLQQTQVATVLPYYDRWLRRFPTLAALARAEESEVLGVWQGLGYYARARNLHRAAQAVVAMHAGEMPLSVPQLRALPGVGRYTAGAVASFAFDAREPAVDANIARLLARLFEIEDPIDERAGQAALWHAAELLLPARGARLHNSALMELGALVCLPRTPRCPVCPVRRYCAAKHPERLPTKRPRRPTIAIEENCAWMTSPSGLLLEQQSGARWAGLWKLPRLESPPPHQEPLWSGAYPFTHHRVTLQIFATSPDPKPGRTWFTRSALPTVPLAAAHRRAIETLMQTNKHLSAPELGT